VIPGESRRLNLFNRGLSPVLPCSLSWKKKRKSHWSISIESDPIDILDGYLAESFHHEITDGGLGLEYGTNLIYPATHHFGREEDGIPDRTVLRMRMRFSTSSRII